MGNLQDLKICENAADSLCTKNLQNQRKVEKASYFWQTKGLITF